MKGLDNNNVQQTFKDIGDEFIIIPKELVKFIDAIQVTLENVDWSPTE